MVVGFIRMLGYALLPATTARQYAVNHVAASSHSSASLPGTYLGRACVLHACYAPESICAIDDMTVCHSTCTAKAYYMASNLC